VTETPPLAARELAAYFALMEASSLLQHAVEKHLKAEGGLSWVQFQILARVSDAPGRQQRMTDLADGVVYSRSGLTYQAGLLEKAGLIARQPSDDDERSTTVTLTDDGRELLARILPGHVDVVRRLMLDPLDDGDLTTLTQVLGRVRDHVRSGPPRSAARRSARASHPAD